MKNILLFCAALLALAASVEAQNVTDSIRISGKIILDFDELDNPEPFSGVGLFIVGKIRGNDYILATATTNNQGEFTFRMPKGEYTIGMWGNQLYRNYALLLEGTHRKVNAQSDVYLGEWTPVVKEYYRYLDDVMQEMKIDGVKVTVR